MTPLTIAIICGIAFVLFGIITLVLQANKMRTFHSDFFGGAGQGLLDAMSGDEPIDEPGLTSEQRLARGTKRLSGAAGGAFGGVFKGILPIMICGFLCSVSGLGGIIALIFHFVG